jgi:UDPglucose 6-dehydrogenase
MRVALLGLTFKAGTDDLRESPALRLGRALLERGAHLVTYDPVALAPGAALLQQIALERGAGLVEVASSVTEACRAANAVVVATEWPEFGALDWAGIAPAMAGDLVVDGRRIVDGGAAAAAGLRVVALGVELEGAALRSAD